MCTMYILSSHLLLSSSLPSPPPPPLPTPLSLATTDAFIGVMHNTHKSCKIRAIQIFITDFVLKTNAIFRQNGIFIRMQLNIAIVPQRTSQNVCGNGGHALAHAWKWFGEIWDEPKSIQIKICKRYVPIRTNTMANADRQMDWPIFQWGFSIV